MLAIGYDSENILMLAGLGKPTNYFETIKLLNNALAELGLQLKTGEDAIISYSSYYISNIANGIAVRSNLNSIDSLCMGLGYPTPIYDFYLFWWAWSDLDYDPDAYPTYWDGASIDNIDQLLIDYAKAWIENNKAIL
ncbi:MULTISPECIES: hypothetical protein [unclassified Mucilaginibacter]|uniref:hypothetical protein n=1 Tax=unclassified Mucilaginibacter TaxID=2617802 RepID=UPI002AC9B71E|nr:MULTISPECIES: hypothetical protein [unclassified Mucilaginibacter]MEB0263303.1 hypothetical protein [Mucilaginibacter sp. 10I4]MEB0278290.1 hypothetical protein [Mucilaginibacter sp. 10B2]MEB0301211.1 hypothetical protein [Mucilaginibacter sp. 5C4]WPX23936.1 hypothetical protein RHM67_01420 [Mucilaginibacter sp. 5C4]